MADDEIAARFSAHQTTWEQAVDNAMLAVYGPLPDWIPEPTVDRTRRTIGKLLSDGLDAKNLARLVGETERGELSFPGIVHDSVAFAQ